MRTYHCCVHITFPGHNNTALELYHLLGPDSSLFQILCVFSFVLFKCFIRVVYRHTVINGLVEVTALKDYEKSLLLRALSKFSNGFLTLFQSHFFKFSSHLMFGKVLEG